MRISSFGTRTIGSRFSVLDRTGEPDLGSNAIEKLNYLPAQSEESLALAEFAHMMAQKYATLDDVQNIVTEQIPEGVNLEYKGSAILINRDASTLCKTVTAMANSAGGIFIIGIEAKDGTPVRVDEGTPGLQSQIGSIKLLMEARSRR